MDKALFLGFASAAFMVTAHVVYIRAIIQKTAVPNKATWLIIAFNTYIYIANQFASDINNAIWGVVLTSVTVSIIASLSLKYGTSSVNKFDLVVVVIALIGVAAWWALDDPRASVIASAITSIISVLPTLNKLRSQPGSEDTPTFFLAGVAMVIQLVAVEPEFDFVLVPATWMVLNFSIAYLNTRDSRLREPARD